MSPAISSLENSVSESVSARRLSPLEVKNIVTTLIPSFKHTGLKEDITHSIIKNQASFWKYIMEKCNLRQIEYGITSAYNLHKQNPSIYHFTMRNITESIQEGLFEKFYSQ